MTADSTRKTITDFLPPAAANFLKDLKDDYYIQSGNRKNLAEWEKNGCPMPPPHAIKQKTIAAFGVKFKVDTLVETGTFHGLMLLAQRKRFKKIISIELDETLFRKAQQTLARFPHIHLYQGDSGQVLRQIVPALREPCLFWLDGHYSGSGTAQGNLDSPIIAELEHILDSPFNHVILIDDAREFTGQNGYPELRVLKTFMQQKRPGYGFKVENDIIQLFPLA